MLTFTLTLHIIAAILWVGGMLFLTLVIVPYLNTLDDPLKRSELFGAIGRRFRLFGWGALIVLIITGPINLHLLDIPPSNILNPKFHGTSYGWPLMMKLGFVFLIVVSSLLHDFWIGPRSRTSDKFRMWARVIGRTNLVIAIVIVVFAVILRTGGV